MQEKDNIIIEMIPAEDGDCILITLEKEDIRILIDGGPVATYKNILKSKLQHLNENGKCIDLLIVTHIDNDHIGGILELLKENGTSEESLIVPIKNIWHNSYRHLQFEKTYQPLGIPEQRILSQYIMAGTTQEISETDGKDKKISAKQGTTLAALLLAGGYSWNQQFDGNAVCMENGRKISLGNYCQITVLCPGKDELKVLESMWRKELKSKRMGFQFSEHQLFDDAYECYMRDFSHTSETVDKPISSKSKETIDILELNNVESLPDNSTTNRSSISIVLKYKGKSLLFLGDAVMDSVCKNLSNTEHFDLVKLPHHGSSRNITKENIVGLNTNRYLVSTNAAKYGHPDLDVLAKIISKKTLDEKIIYFNYTLEHVLPLMEEMKTLGGTEFVFLQENESIRLDCELEEGD